MSKLIEKLRNKGSVKATTIAESTFFNQRELVTTHIPALNIALGGSIHSGLGPGLLMIAGPSKTFKTAMALYMVASYLNEYKDAICLYYDSEFGSSPEYLKTFGIDIERTLHIPVEHLEQLKFDMTKRLEEVQRGDKVIILVDSIGNIASKKEVEDAQDEKSVADMSRAKQMKSLWRIVTPHLTLKDLPCIAINHIYMEQGLYPKAIISGGTGAMYSSNAAWIIGKSQEKNKDGDLIGFNFTINIEKSRFVIERSKIPLTVTFEGGINKYSGILDLALEGNFVAKPTNGWYQLVDQETGELIGGKVREKDTQTDEFLGVVLNDPKFDEYIKKTFKLAYTQS